MTVTQAGTARRSIITKAAVLAMTAIIAGLITWSLFGPSPPPLPGTFKLSIPLAPAGKTALIHAGNIRLVLSPDGNLLVLSDPADEKKQLYVRSLVDSYEIKPIPGTENAYDPFFSPDGQWLAFFTQDAPDKRSLWKLRMNQNGSKVFLAESQHAFGQGTWSDDDLIFFCGGDDDDDDNLRGIFQVSADGGTPERLSIVNSESSRYYYPRVLPDGKTVMYHGGRGTICLLSRVTGKSTVLLRNAQGAQYSHTGHLLFNRYGQLYAVPFDVDTLKKTGPVALVIRDVPAAGRHSLRYFSIARNGTLAYVPLPSEASSLVWVEHQGKFAPVAGSPDGRYSNPRLSPKETELAVMILENDRRHIWRYDLDREVSTQLTFGRFYTRSPEWVLPDADRISFSSVQIATVDKPQLLSLSVDGTGRPEPLFPVNRDFWQVPLSWSSDGKYLAYNERYSTSTPTSRIWILPFGDNGKPGEPALFLAEKQHVPEARFRPSDPSDGRCIAYSSDKTGRDEIYIEEFLWGNLSEGWVERISSEGGTEPCWSRDGSKLFYRNANGMMEVTVHANQDGTIEVGKSQLLFEDSIYSTSSFGHTNYDVTSDGRFIMVKDVPPTQINVILNWAEELRRLAPTVKD